MRRCVAGLWVWVFGLFCCWPSCTIPGVLQVTVQWGTAKPPRFEHFEAFRACEPGLRGLTRHVRLVRNEAVSTSTRAYNAGDHREPQCLPLADCAGCFLVPYVQSVQPRLRAFLKLLLQLTADGQKTKAKNSDSDGDGATNIRIAVVVAVLRQTDFFVCCATFATMR